MVRTRLPALIFHGGLGVCAAGLQVVPATLMVRPVAGDFDADGDVDQDDFGHFQTCLAPMNVAPIPACQDADLNKDSSVDQTDLAIFKNCHSGAGLPADPNCAGTFTGDFDGDGDVDQDDFGHLQICLTPVGVAPIIVCQDADLNRDSSVDEIDLAILKNCHSGAGVPVNPDCAG